MTAKTTNIIYWVSTIIFGGLMIFSSVGGIQPMPQTIEMLHDGLGYPIYFIQFISIAKLIADRTKSLKIVSILLGDGESTKSVSNS